MNIIKKIAIYFSVLLAISSSVAPAFADTVNVTFESPTYTIGDINGQDGWTKTGNYDAAVVSNTFGFSTFGSQSLRISDAVTSGAFGDQTFAKPLADSVGETSATNGAFSAGTKQRHFETQFDVASTQATEQVGMHMSVSPDRGDGSRMSYLRFDDMVDGIHVFFDDVTDAGPVGTDANFNEIDIATIDRNPHTIKLTLDTLDGPANDVVKVWIDGVLKHTGTSWEDYYRYDVESAVEQSPRIVKTVLFRESSTANASDSGKGFLVDNFSMNSGPIPPVLVGPPVHKDDCKNGGWQTFNTPSFKNQGKCIDYVEHHNHRVRANNAQYQASGLNREVEFEMDTASNRGNFIYTDGNKDRYRVQVSEVMVDGNSAWFAGVVTSSKNNAYNGNWLFAKVIDNGVSGDQIWGSFTSQFAAESGVTNKSTPGDGPFTLFRGNIKVN